MIIRKSPAEIEGMARAGALLAETLALVGEHLEPGVTMRELDRIADEHLGANGATPTSKGYKGFPAALCISPNSMVVHGIPNDYAAREGDLISLDLGVTLDGLVADSAITLPVGEISPEAQRLLGRAAAEGRSDDTHEAIERRLELYDRETAPLVEYYRSTRVNVVGVHAERSVDEVFHEIQQALDSLEGRAA